MRLMILTLADSANTAEGSKLNVFGIFDTIFAKSFPVTHHGMVIAMRFAVESRDLKREHHVQLELKGADGSLILEGTGEIPAPLPQIRHLDQVIRVPHLTFPTAGDYELRVSVNDKLLGYTTLRLQETKDA